MKQDKGLATFTFLEQIPSKILINKQATFGGGGKLREENLKLCFLVNEIYFLLFLLFTLLLVKCCFNFARKKFDKLWVFPQCRVRSSPSRSPSLSHSYTSSLIDISKTKSTFFQTNKLKQSIDSVNIFASRADHASLLKTRRPLFLTSWPLGVFRCLIISRLSLAHWHHSHHLYLK